jgi:hypothetical protein
MGAAVVMSAKYEWSYPIRAPAADRLEWNKRRLAAIEETKPEDRTADQVSDHAITVERIELLLKALC